MKSKNTNIINRLIFWHFYADNIFRVRPCFLKQSHSQKNTSIVFNLVNTKQKNTIHVILNQNYSYRIVFVKRNVVTK